MSVFAISLFPNLKTEVSFKKFFPKGEPALAHYESFVQIMGSSENAVVIAITHEPTVFDSVFLTKLQKFQSHLEGIPHIVKAPSILSLEQPSIPLPFLHQKKHYVDPERPEYFTRDSIRIFQDFEITQHFITKDSRIVKIILQLSDSLSLDAIDSLTQAIDSIASTLSIGGIHMLGRKYMESEYNKLMKHEMRISVILSFTFVILILFLLYRSFAGVLLPLLCMAVSLIMLYGFMALFHRPLTIMSNLFPTIILIVGISDVIHISSKFAYETLQTPNPILAIDKTIKEIGFTTFLNSFTTALGFLTLLTMSMEAQRSFGVDAAVGLMITWVNSVFLLPALLTRFNLNRAFVKPMISNQWHTLLDRILKFTSKYPKHILFSFLTLVLISIIGLYFMNTNNFMVSNIPVNNRLHTDYIFFDNHLGGGRSFELMIHTKHNERLSHQRVIMNIEKLEKYLESKAGVSEIISPVSVVKWLNQAVHPHAGWQLPATQEEYDYLFTMTKAKENRFALKVTDTSDTLGRLYGHVADIGRKKMEYLLLSMHQWMNSNIDTSLVQFVVTGPDYMTDIAHRLRIENMTWSFFLEILVVSLLIGIIYKSGLMVLVTFISSIIPVILIGGFMGYAGIVLRGNITIIFAVGYVIAVDDTLHFVNRFQLERRKGLTVKEALNKTILYSGRAMVMTSLVLLGGFMILIYSDFGDIYMLGFLISLIILVAMITELLLVPVLIRYLFKEKLNGTSLSTK